MLKLKLATTLSNLAHYPPNLPMPQKIIIPLFTTLVLLFFAWSSLAQNAERIAWSDSYKLSWADFQGKPDLLEVHLQKAETKTTIEVVTKIRATTIEYEVVCYFERNQSWAKVDTSSALLAHEQLHFDISEIYARKLREQLPELTFISRDDLERQVRALYGDILLETVEFQHQYDLETEHSKNREQQKKWTEKIKAMLEDTNYYQATTVVAVK